MTKRRGVDVTSGRPPTRTANLALTALIGAVLLLLMLSLIFLWINPEERSIFRPATLTTTASSTPSPAYTATETPTDTLTPRPTWTLRPSETPTTTPTPTITSTPPRTFIATLVPAAPVAINDRYGLADYGPLEAGKAAEMMRQLPGLKYSAGKRSQPAYHAMYQYAVFAYREALLQFPGNAQADAWRWGLAFSLAQTGSSEAGPLYARLLTDRLTGGSLPLSDLPGWFKNQEPELELTMHNLPTRPGYLGLYLLELQPGDMFFWMTISPNSLNIYPLTEKFQFDAAQRATFLYTDMTGDNIPELAVYRQASGDTIFYEPQFFDLAPGAPQELALQNSLPLDLNTDFQFGLSCVSCIPGQAGRVTLNALVFPACPLEAGRAYQWDGSRMAYLGLRFSALPTAETLAQCETMLALAADFYPPAANLALAQALQPLWPPALDLKGRLYPADSADGMRLRQVINLALTGSRADARALSNQIVAEDIQRAAQPFATAQNPAELFAACQAQALCNPHQAFGLLLSESPAVDVEAAYAELLNDRLSLAASGIFDFNQDGQNERWLTVKPRAGEVLEFWILAQARSGVRLLYVTQVENARPEIYFSVQPGTEPVFQFISRQGYMLRQTNDGQELLIQQTSVDPALTTYTLDNLNAAEQALFNGVSAGSVRDRLRSVLRSGRFNCKTHQICDRFYYLLSLTYEMSGDQREAVETYLKLWWENKTSPYTTLARLKLSYYAQGAPPAGATPTHTPTRTPVFTSTPLPPGIASPTATPTGTEEPYPTPQQSYP